MLREGLIPTPSSTFRPNHHGVIIVDLLIFLGPSRLWNSIHAQKISLGFIVSRNHGDWLPGHHFFGELFLRCTIFSKRGWSAVVEGDTVDRRNPAPPGMWKTLKWWDIWYAPYQTGAGFLQSTVSCEASFNWGPLQLPCLLGQRSRFIPWLDP